MNISTVPGQPGHLAEVLNLCFPSTPPVENSEPPGATGREDGQGVCTRPWRVEVTRKDGFKRVQFFSLLSDAAVFVTVMVAAGRSCLVERLA